METPSKSDLIRCLPFIHSRMGTEQITATGSVTKNNRLHAPAVAASIVTVHAGFVNMTSRSIPACSMESARKITKPVHTTNSTYR